MSAVVNLFEGKTNKNIYERMFEIPLIHPNRNSMIQRSAIAEGPAEYNN